MSDGKRVLVIGEEPELMDYSNPAVPPGMSAEKVRAGLDASAERLNALGHHAELCLTAEEPAAAAAAVVERLRATRFDCVVIGAGIRVVPKNFTLFETLLNVVHEHAPQARIAFNSRPDDSDAAALRWV